MVFGRETGFFGRWYSVAFRAGFLQLRAQFYNLKHKVRGCARGVPGGLGVVVVNLGGRVLKGHAPRCVATNRRAARER